MATDPRRKFIEVSTVPGVVPASATPVPGSLRAYAADTRPSIAPGAMDATAPVLGPGVVIHQYELIRELGRGGMGVVFAARDTRLGRRVAIKFVLNAEREVAERFVIEARATAQCNHDNIVIIHAVDEYAGMPYMVLEFLEGTTLREVMDTQLQLAPSRVVEIMVPIARALARAHELGVVHRDLKPENVFVTTAGQVKVLDFGIAKAFGAGDASRASARDAWQHLETTSTDLDFAPGITAASTMVGTIAYMAPEQMGIDEVDHRADLWAAGIMMFEMLAGRHPIDPPTMQELINSAASDDPMPAIAAVEPGTPAELAALVDACLVKPKQTRLPSAIALARSLEALLPGRAGRTLADGESPYPGLTAFQEADANRFFGRAREVTRLVAKIRELPLTGVIGPSGAGKSSVVRAGVGPALKASGEYWNVVTLRPGRAPLAALAGVVYKLGQFGATSTVLDTLKDTQTHEALARRIAREPGYLGAALRARARQTGGHILLFVDQLEELYTLVPNIDERRAFTAALAGVADDSTAPLRVVVSMRSDFLDRLSEDARFVEELSRGLVFVGTPDDAGLREALVQPIEMVGYRFETAEMIDDMLRALDGTPGALPLLQFAASKLWDARDRDRRMLSLASYHRIGGVSGALATHADDVVANMDSQAQRLAQKVLRALVTPEHTRAIVELAELQELAPDRAEVMRVIDQLVAARLLVVQTRGDGGGSSVEIVHESLIARWPTLRRWLEEDQEASAFAAQINAAAKQWDAKGRPAGMLWRGAAASEAARWLALRPRELPARDRAFADAVVALAKRGARTRRAALIGAFVLMAGVAGGASVAYISVEAAKAAAVANAEAAERGMKLADEHAREAERQRIAAEQAKAAALTANTAKDAAKDEAAKAQSQVVAADQTLDEQNKQLKALLSTAQAAQARAEAATATAKQSAAEAERARTALQTELAAKQARVKELEDQKSKLSTKLK